MVLSHFFLHDPCNLLRTTCTFGLVAGVILIFQPQTLLFATTTQVGKKTNYKCSQGGCNQGKALLTITT